MPFIKEIYAREVLDSRGNPTVEVEVYTESDGLVVLSFQVGLLLENTSGRTT